MSFTVTCAQCREEVLGADLIGDAEECLLRDHLLAVHPKTVQPDTLTMLLRHFVVSEGSPPAALRERRAFDGQVVTHDSLSLQWLRTPLASS